MHSEAQVGIAPNHTAILQEIGKIRTELGAEWRYDPNEKLQIENLNLGWDQWTTAFCLHTLAESPNTHYYSQPAWEIGAKHRYPIYQLWINPEEACQYWLGHALANFSTDVLNLPAAIAVEEKSLADGQYEESIASASKRIIGQAGNPGEKVAGTKLLILTLKDMREQLLPELLARSFAKKYDWKPNQILNPKQRAELTHYTCMMDKFSQAAVVDTAYELLHNEKAEQEYTMLHVKNIVEPAIQAIESELGLKVESAATSKVEIASTDVAQNKPVVNREEVATFVQNVDSPAKRASFLQHPIHYGQSTADHLESDLIAFLGRDVTLDQVREGINARMQTALDVLKAFPAVYDRVIPDNYQI